MRPLIPLLLVLALLAGCSTNPVTGEQDLVLMSESQEIALGRQSHPQILEQYGRYDDPALQAYVNEVGERLAEQTHRPDLVYRFTVVDSDQVNAFALPGGYIYVTRGILAYFNSEAELAGVLAHELGHVAARHSVRQYTNATLTGIAGSLIAAEAGSRAAADLVNVLGTALVRGYSRRYELEADRLGAQYLARAGYEPRTMLEVLGILKDQEAFARQLAEEQGREYRGYSGLMATHPSNDRRLQELVAQADQYRRAEPRPANREGYLEAIDGLVFGPGRDQGVLRNNRFYHAGLDIGLTLPEGWRLENRPDRLLAIAGKQEAVLQVTARDLGKRMGPEAFMRRELGLDDLRGGRALRGGSWEGFTALANADTPFGRRTARFAVLVHGKKAYVFAGATRAGEGPGRFDAAFVRTINSFHELDAAERELAEPRRIVIHEVAPGERFEQLAGETAFADHAVDRLRLLNGAYPDGQPRAGERVKLVR